MARPRTVLVPTDLSLIYDGAGWRFGNIPPQWWIKATEPEQADADVPIPFALTETGRTGRRPVCTGPECRACRARVRAHQRRRATG